MSEPEVDVEERRVFAIMVGADGSLEVDDSEVNETEVIGILTVLLDRYRSVAASEWEGCECEPDD